MSQSQEEGKENHGYSFGWYSLTPVTKDIFVWVWARSLAGL